MIFFRIYILRMNISSNILCVVQFKKNALTYCDVFFLPRLRSIRAHNPPISRSVTQLRAPANPEMGLFVPTHYLGINDSIKY